MNVVVLCGRLSSDPQVRTLASGSTLWSLEVTTHTDEGAVSVPVAWFDPPEAGSFATGDTVVVVGSVRRRFFRTGGATQSRTEVVATDVLPGSNRRKTQRAVARVAEGLGDALDQAVRSD